MLEHLDELMLRLGIIGIERRDEHIRKRKVTAHSHVIYAHHANARIAHLCANDVSKPLTQMVGNSKPSSVFFHQVSEDNSKCPRELFGVEDFNLVARSDVVVVLHANSALETISNFAHVVLETSQ
jgi:hypothetical protein